MNGARGGDGSRCRAADALCRTLTERGVSHLFGVPGTQTLQVSEALRHSDLRWVVPSNELAAAFMANGYYRSSGRPGVLVTIPGPGFTWALTGLAEARLDSAAVLCLTGVHPGRSDRGRLQDIPHARIAGPVVKRIQSVASAEDLAAAVADGYRTSLAGEPGPVIIEVEHPVWSESCRPPEAPAPEAEPIDPDAVEVVGRRLARSKRPLLIAGQGCQEGALELRGLAESLDAPVLVTTSGRGALPDDHRLAVTLDRIPDARTVGRDLIDRADLLLVLGCRLGHNATLGGSLRFPREKLVRIDASRAVLEEERHPASLAVEADVPSLLLALLETREGWARSADRWDGGRWDGAGGVETSESTGEWEPTLRGGTEVSAFFDALRRVMPQDACLVTDSGLHQMMARRHFRVDAPRSLVTPTNFQSMGFGIPAAIGACLASPGRRVVALVGDGGLRLSAFELVTARSLGIDLTVVVFADGYFGLIRRSQIDSFGRGSGVDLPDLDLAALAAALGVEHDTLGRDLESTLGRCIEAGGVRLVEVPLEDPAGLWKKATYARARQEVRRMLGPRHTEELRALRDRWRRLRGSR